MRRLITISGHLVFWVASYLALSQLFGSVSFFSGFAFDVDHTYNLLFHAVLIPFVYVNLNFVMPKVLKAMPWLYPFAALALVGLGAAFNLLFFDHLVDYVLPGYYFISYYTFGGLFLFYFIYIALTSLIKLSRGWFELQSTQQKLAETEKEKLGAELQSLKNQVNPHFLFNSLNSIYSLVLSQDKVAPEIILKLSQVLRYMLYEAEKDKMPLEKEISFLQDYVDLSRLRTNSKINFSLTGQPADSEISPLILLPLVENAIKYGGSGSTDGRIELTVVVDDKSLRFQSSNTIAKLDEVHAKEHSGLGLKNVRRRLQLLYPNAHHFEIDQTKDTFEVKLQITL